jgi:hypothetical protein
MRRVEFKRGPQEEEAWLQTLGKTSAERTERLGSDVIRFRQQVGLPPVNPEIQAKFNHYIHDIDSPHPLLCSPCSGRLQSQSHCCRRTGP